VDLTFDSGRTFTVVDMDGYSISQVADRTGFPPTTLRFYEQSGLVRPARTPAGYRCYDDTHIELLSFIGRAKGFGLSLDEITELLDLLRDDDCAPVQGRLRDLVDAKIADAQAKVTELEAFTNELRRVAADLGTHTPAGPCDDSCGCTSDGPTAAHQPVVLGRRHDDRDQPAIACKLSAHEVGDRLARWEAMVATATGRRSIDGGTRLTFRRDVEIAAIAALVAAEQDCCRFFTFTLTVASDGVVLDVSGPSDAQPVIDALIGVAS
jgi:DNA-binding transcriptional MerR regulator